MVLVAAEKQTEGTYEGVQTPPTPSSQLSPLFGPYDIKLEPKHAAATSASKIQLPPPLRIPPLATPVKIAAADPTSLPQTPTQCISDQSRKVKSPFQTPPLRPCSPFDEVEANELMMQAYELGLPRVSWSSYQRIRTLGGGANTVVLLATQKVDGKPVVIKRLASRCRHSLAAAKEIANEACVMSSLGKHYATVSILGAGHVEDDGHSGEYACAARTFLVFEYLDGETLADHTTRLRMMKDAIIRPNSSGRLFSGFPAQEFFLHTYDLANALLHLHTAELEKIAFIVHRDIKAGNIGFARRRKDSKRGPTSCEEDEMYDDSSPFAALAASTPRRLKLMDLGLAKPIARNEKSKRHRSITAQAYDVNYPMTPTTGSQRYSAPEVRRGEKYNASCDVYSFGLIAFEMAAGTKPFSGHSFQDHYERVVVKGERPEFPPNWPKDLQDLLASCWHEDPQARPTMQAVVNEAMKMLQHSARGDTGWIDTFEPPCEPATCGNCVLC